MIPIRVFEGRRIAVFGLGTSGAAAARALAVGGAHVAAWDDDAGAREAAQAQDIPLVDLAKADWRTFAALVLAPGVPLTHPEPHWSAAAAQAAGVEIIGDTELFFRQRAAQGAKCRVIGITGTNGKSTTSALVDHLLAFSCHRSVLGGNIGTAILNLDHLNDDMIYVIEFSSYQLDLTPSLELSHAVLLNITPDHLDRHGDFKIYARVKGRIFSKLDPEGCAVVGIDDEASRSIADSLSGPYRIARISTRGPVKNGVFAHDGMLIEMSDGAERSQISCAEIASLRGEHNWQNAAAALAVARAYGLEAGGIADGLRAFPGLAHRMEEIARLGEVLFINDSKATNAEAAAKALASFEDVYWIAGGRAKQDGLDGLEAFYPRIRRAYLIGEAASDFAARLNGDVDHEIVETIDKAVQAAARDARAQGAREPVVLLSPACASFDQYANFSERGEAFRAAVASLCGGAMAERCRP